MYVVLRKKPLQVQRKCVAFLDGWLRLNGITSVERQLDASLGQYLFNAIITHRGRIGVTPSPCGKYLDGSDGWRLHRDDVLNYCFGIHIAAVEKIKDEEPVKPDIIKLELTIAPPEEPPDDPADFKPFPIDDTPGGRQDIVPPEKKLPVAGDQVEIVLLDDDEPKLVIDPEPEPELKPDIDDTAQVRRSKVTKIVKAKKAKK